ncbi:MAG: hypothetical protein ACR2M9_00640, partial [Cyanophyceae cyanobacterium]
MAKTLINMAFSISKMTLFASKMTFFYLIKIYMSTLDIFINDDDYFTPKNVWEDIKHLIPSNKEIWEPFYGDGKSGIFLQELGFKVIHENEDFFKNNKGDIIVSNPPFSNTNKIIKRLKEIDKPFILILPISRICTQYFKEFRGKIQIIIPKKRISFIKNNKILKSPPFCCVYY